MPNTLTLITKAQSVKETCKKIMNRENEQYRWLIYKVVSFWSCLVVLLQSGVLGGLAEFSVMGISVEETMEI